MSVPDPMAVIRRVLLDEESVTDLLLPQTQLPSLATAPIFAYEYPRKVTGHPQTGYTGHDWAALLQAKSIEMVLITPSGRIASGSDNSRVPFSRPRFDVQVFGRTFSTAAAVHWAIYEYLKALGQVRAVLSGGTAHLFDCTVEGGPISFPDPDVECPVVTGIYAASVAEQYVEVA